MKSIRTYFKDLPANLRFQRWDLPSRLMILGAFGIILTSTSLLGYLAYENVNSLLTELRQAVKPKEYLQELQRMIADLSLAENSVNRFEVSGNTSALLEYYRRTQNFYSRAELLRAQSADDTLLQETNRLLRMMERKYALLAKRIQLQDDGLVSSVFSNLVRADSLKRDSSLFQKLFSGEESGLAPGDTVITLSELLEANARLEEERRKRSENLQRLRKEEGKLTSDIAKLSQQVSARQDAKARISALKADEQASASMRFIGSFTVIMVIICLVLLMFIVNDLDRTRRLQDTLEAEKSRAEKLAKAKEEFLANMSHEIRTPMNAVIGFAEQLAGTSLAPSQQQLLDPIRHSAQYLLALINDILDYSKLESGSFQLEKTGFRPAEVLEAVENTFQGAARAKGVSLQVTQDASLPEVLAGDPLRLRQMLFNLVSNAVKFTHEGSVQVRASAEAQGPEQVMALFEVLDTGIGIAPEQLERLFTEFEQGDSSITRKYGGTGLGLVITRRLALLHGGEVRLESEPGQGTRARLTLPYALGKLSEAAPQAHPAASQAGQLRGLRVLLADDEPYNRRLVELILGKWGAQFVSVENGRQLIEALRGKADAFDLVLADLQMPELDGVSAARIIRSEISPSIPIIALTATSTQREIEEARRAGMNAHLLKPFQEQELYRLIRQLLDSPAEPAPEAQAGTPYQFGELLQLANGDTRFMLSLLEIFLNTAPAHLESLEAALAAADWEQAAFAAHRLTPPCRHLGLYELAQQLKEIETQAYARQELEALPGKIRKASAALRALIPALRADVARLRGNA